MLWISGASPRMIAGEAGPGVRCSKPPWGRRIAHKPVMRSDDHHDKLAARELAITGGDADESVCAGVLAVAVVVSGCVAPAQPPGPPVMAIYAPPPPDYRAYGVNGPSNRCVMQS